MPPDPPVNHPRRAVYLERRAAATDDELAKDHGRRLPYPNKRQREHALHSLLASLVLLATTWSILLLAVVMTVEVAVSCLTPRASVTFEAYPPLS